MGAWEFDWIIVGAGSAGCVLAERLSRNSNARILVIEAGGSDRKFWVKVPLGYGKLFFDQRVNWCFHADPDPGLAGRSAFWPRGRILGGSGSINAMAYVRGLAQDYDGWANLGAAGWEWRNVRQAFEELEAPDSGLKVTSLDPKLHPFSRHVLAAGRDMGWRHKTDVDGVAAMRATLWRGRRWSPADAFLRPALRRKSLRLVTGALVETLEMSDGRVTGVTFSCDGQRITAKARTEVILSAGAIGSPQILQLSGIGDPTALRAMGIPVRHPLTQVGQGLQDHLALTFGYRATEPTLNGTLGWTHGRLLAGLRYLLTRSGPLSLPINQVSGFVRSDDTQPTPDMQLYGNPMSYSARNNGLPAIEAEPGFLLSAQPCRPTSRGRISLASRDPREAPVIQPNSLSTETDRRQAVRAARLLRRVAATPSIRAVTRSEARPEIAHMSDDDLLSLFRFEASSVYHASCTCRMGPDAARSVTDARLRVHGLRGLRVVDASAFPSVTSGNTQAPVMMLAHRAAGFILEDSRKGGGA